MFKIEKYKAIMEFQREMAWLQILSAILDFSIF